MNRLAKSLLHGNTIGYFSPSSPVTRNVPSRYERARRYLQAQGHALVSGSLTGKSDHYRSGTIKSRAAEFNELLRNPDVRVVMSTIGGQNSNALLPYIDYDAIIEDPKIIIGYSDAAAILLGIYQMTGLVTFYGPALVASFGEFPPVVDETYASFRTILGGEQTAPYTYGLPEKWTDEMVPWDQQTGPKNLYENTCAFHGEGVIEGRIIGGNLNTIWSIWGSPYMPEIREGDILLIEDSLKPIATVERLFMFLRLNGVFDRVSAIVLGKHEQLNDQGSGRTSLEVLLEVLDGQRIPIVDGFDSCHTHPMLTVPIGIDAQINFDEEQVTLLQPWVR